MVFFGFFWGGVRIDGRMEIIARGVVRPISDLCIEYINGCQPGGFDDKR